MIQLQTQPRTHFVRILSMDQVNHCVGQLNEAVGKLKYFPLVTSKQDTFEYKAPDGDCVFAGLKHPSGRYLCRLHKEVFSEEIN